MALYEVRRRLLDSDNGYVLDRGSIISTNETAWVKRFGSDLRKVSVVPSGMEAIEISDTVEQAKEGPVKIQEKEAEFSPESTLTKKPTVTKVAKKSQNKVIDESDSEIKDSETE